MAELEEGFSLKGIALTGYGMEGDIVRSRATGFVAHLTKPVSMQTLDAAIAAMAMAFCRADGARSAARRAPASPGSGQPSVRGPCF